MKLIKEEYLEKQFTISLSESELGTILVSVGHMSVDEANTLNNKEYNNSIKLVDDNYKLFIEIKKILGISN